MFELLNDRYDVDHLTEFYNHEDYPKSWNIYYKDVLCNVWESNGYGVDVWTGSQQVVNTHHRGGMTKEQVLNVLDTYLPKRKTEQLVLF